MYKSINQWSFPSGYSAGQCLLAAKAAGYQGFEPAFYEEGELSLQGFAPAASELRRLADGEGMELASLASGLYWNYPLTASSAATRAKALDIVKRQIDAANALGVDAILVVPGTVGKGFWGGQDCVSYEDAYERAREGLMAVAPYAEAAGVTIGVENVWNNFLLSPLEMRAFLDGIASDRVQAYFDVGNVTLFGQSEQWIRILGKRICRVHVKDFKRSVGTLDGFCDLLAGDVDFPEVMRALAEIGYDGPLTAEMGSYKYDPLGLVEMTSHALDRILKGGMEL